MAKMILQVNFKFSVSRAEFEQLASDIAKDFAALPGLQWKIWLMNEEEKEAGGIYLFKDEVSVKAYLEGPLAAQVMSHPALSQMSAKVFGVIDDVTAITRGPVSK